RPGNSDDIRQSYAVLAGLTSHTHGMVAAATMSLPEHEKGYRNYDYRYVWIRDQCYTGQALAALGDNPLFESALTFVTQRVLEDGSQLKPAYCVDGRSVPSQRHVGLAGYPGGSDVAGNLVHQQFQLDTFGELLNLYSCAARLDRMTDRLWRAIEVCVRAIENCWQVPDNGVWELEAETWVHSRLACIAGLKSISQYAQMPLRLRCEELAERILSVVASCGERVDRMTDRLWRAIEVCVRAIENCWQVPDNGVWELEAETWVHSRLACIAGLKSISQYAQMPLRLRCEELAERILRDIASYGVNQEG